MSAEPKHQVTESITGYYFYHLSPVKNHTRSLCDENTMQTHIPLLGWGKPGPPHIRYKWCEKCKALSEKEDTE